MPGTYIFLFDSVGYQIAWVDSEGVENSPLCPWEFQDPHLLLGYIYSLYFPPHDHITADTSIHSPQKVGYKTAWTIDCAGQRFTDCRRIFQGGVWDRRTTVFESTGEQKDDFVIIKDSFGVDDNVMDEADYLRSIHEDGVVPGVVTMVECENVTTVLDDGSLQPVKTAPPMDRMFEGEEVLDRIKQRLIMGSKGVTLSEANSALDILMSVYDLLEILRWLTRKKKFLYRDVSNNNILMYPVHNKYVRDRSLVRDPPSLINRVLGLETGNVTIQSSRCLLIDFDNTIPLLDEQTGEPPRELKRVTGTYPYISRAVQRSAPLSNEDHVSLQFEKMPRLHGKVRQIYEKFYGKENYEKYNDNEDGTYHGGVLPEDPNSHFPSNDEFYRQPRHDVESVYRLLVATLVRAAPPGRLESENSHSLRELGRYWAMFEGEPHHCTMNNIPRFEDVLHPSLRSLAPMLSSLTAQINPEYAYLIPPPPVDHLHEAFIRILLKEIVEMKDQGRAIPLEPRNERPIIELNGRPRMMPLCVGTL
ncbi:hypothetical protein ABKN59_009864 [Abortiporus biennis]